MYLFIFFLQQTIISNFSQYGNGIKHIYNMKTSTPNLPQISGMTMASSFHSYNSNKVSQ